MTGKITGKDRIEAALNRQYADRVPVVMEVAPHCAKLLGFTHQEYVLDPDKQIKALMKARDLYPSDMVRVPGDPLSPEVFATAQQVASELDKKRERFFADKTRLQSYKFRDPRENPRYAAYLKRGKEMSAMLPDVAIMATVPGLWAGAVELRGAEEIIYDSVDDPAFVHGLTKLTTEMSRQRATAVCEAGVKYVRFGEPSSSCSLISPGIYREFARPYHAELFGSLKKKFPDVRLGFHCCGYVDPIMEDLASLPVDWVEIDAPSSLEKMMKTAPRRMAVRGNVAAEVFSEGKKEDIEKAVKACIDIAAAGSGYMLAAGCTIPITTPLENIGHFLEAANRYGKYDRHR